MKKQGWDEVRNISCVGCGPVQENFVGCADISIRDLNQPELSTTTSTKTTELSTTTVPASTSPTSQSTESTSSSSSSSSVTASSSISPLTSLLTTRSASTNNGYNGCRSKVEFGTMIDLSREIAIYCSRMCDMRCETIVAEMEEDDNENYKLDRNYIACTQTCPQLCSCN
jgi:hypothetical protein